MHHRVSAIFSDRTQAELAVEDLRRNGIIDTQLSVLSRNVDEPHFLGGGGGAVVDDVRTTDVRRGDDVADATGKGLLGGAGIGALFGLAAALIPGVGPFIAAGSLATILGATGGAVAAGAIVGATSGAVAGALSKAGYDEREARWYGDEVERGGVLLAVDTHEAAIPEMTIRDILVRHGGRMA
jgi:hypothetical protein